MKSVISKNHRVPERWCHLLYLTVCLFPHLIKSSTVHMFHEMKWMFKVNMRAVTPKKDLSKHLQDSLTSVMKLGAERFILTKQKQWGCWDRHTKVTAKLGLTCVQLISAPSGALECNFIVDSTSNLNVSQNLFTPSNCSKFCHQVSVSQFVPTYRYMYTCYFCVSQVSTLAAHSCYICHI